MDGSARVIDADEDYREGLFDIAGNAITPLRIRGPQRLRATGYFVAQREEGLNVRGALDAAGNVVIPFQYGDIRFLSERWALGVMLEETSIRPCDYEDYIDGKNYNAISYDVYDLRSRACVGYFSYRCEVIRAHGDYLYAQIDDGSTGVYDERLRLVRDDAADPYTAFATLDGNVVSLGSGEVVLEDHLFGAELGEGLLSVSDGGEKLGICEETGRMLTDCVFDRVYAADASGEVRVEQDGKFGLVGATARWPCPASTTASSALPGPGSTSTACAAAPAWSGTGATTSSARTGSLSTRSFSRMWSATACAWRAPARTGVSS